MNEEEIKKLSKKLAQTLHEDNAYFVCASWTNYTPVDCKAYELEKTLEVLLRDYCIVPKVDVVDWVNTLENFMPNTQSATMMKIGAKRLFGKELF